MRDLCLRPITLCLLCTAACGPDDIELDEVDARATEPIVGGATFNSVPAIAALFLDAQPHCTATLIAPRKALTAAHCVAGVRPSRLELRVGPNAWAPTTTVGVVRVRPHPEFDADLLANDIAVVTLRAAVAVEPLYVVSHMDESWIGRRLVFVGYGVTDGASGRGAGKKRAAVMPIGEIDATRFAYYAAAKNTCHGDSGGPALAREADGRYVVAGITSWGDSACAQFGIDTRVDVYADFIGE